MTSPLIIVKSYYLKYGNKAPSNSEYSGIINTASLIGFVDYTKRKNSRIMSKDAEKASNNYNASSLFDYTSKRTGSTKTFTSNGWINDKYDLISFKKNVSRSFNKEGDICWSTIISLKDFDTAYKYGLKNEEDYAAIIQSIFPKWLDKVGFKNNNILFWSDYHVNTENPHIHLQFLEINSTRSNPKLSLNDLNRLKGSFWNELQKYQKNNNPNFTYNLKNKDKLKQNIVNKIEINNLKTNQLIEEKIYDLYKNLPDKGRLQYNSIHLISYKKQIDDIVDCILNLEDIKPIYNEFRNSCDELDQNKSKELKQKYTNYYDNENLKLRTLIANKILFDFKKCSNEFKNNTTYINSIINDKNKLVIPISNKLIKNNNSMVKIPNSDNLYLNLDELEKIKLIDTNSNMNFFYIDANENINIYDVDNTVLTSIGHTILEEKFSDGKIQIENIINKKVLFSETQSAINIFSKENVNGYETNFIKKSLNSNKLNSISWMKRIQKQVESELDEFYSNSERGLNV